MPSLFETWTQRLRRLPVVFWVWFGLLALGALFRTLGYFGGDNGLWNDEANWVLRMAQGQSGGGIRPPAYVWLNRALIAWHPSEALLRSTSWVAGLASLPLFLVIARRTGLDRVTTSFGLFLLAVHPWAIAYAKEWKPYGLELTMHLVVTLATLAYVRRPSWTRLFALAAVCGVTLLFAWSVVFQFPGVFAIAVATQWRTGQRRQLGLTSGVALVGALAIVAMHHARLARLLAGRTGSDKFWGTKYGVFYLVKGDPLGKLAWQLEQSWNVARFPFEVKAFWDPSGRVTAVFAFVGGALVLTGIVLLVARRRWLWLALWVLPGFMTLVANWIGLWPYGVFRTNVYLLVYPLWLALYAAHALGTWCARRRPLPAWLAPALALALALPFTPYDLHYFRYKDVATNALSTSLGRSLQLIHDRSQKEKTVQLVLDGYACGTAQYYLRHHPTYRRLGPWYRKHVRIQCADNSVPHLTRRVQRLGKRPSWVITARPLSAAPTRSFLDRHCDVDYRAHLPTADTLDHCRPK